MGQTESWVTLLDEYAREWKYNWEPEIPGILTELMLEGPVSALGFSQKLLKQSDRLPNLIRELAVSGEACAWETIFLLTKACPEAVEGALDCLRRSSGNREKIKLLEALYMNFPQYSVAPAVRMLTSGNYFVQREAKLILATRKDYRSCVFDMLACTRRAWGMSDNSSEQYMAGEAARWIISVRTSAERFLEWPDGEIAVRCINALAEHGLHSILWAFPSGLPDINLVDHPSDYNYEEYDMSSLYRNLYFVLMLNAETLETPPLAREARNWASGEFDEVAHHVFCRWIEEGRPENRRKGVILFFVSLISRKTLPELEQYIDEVADQGLIGHALDAIHAMSCRSGLKNDLERIGREHKNKQVREAAALASGK